MSKQTTLHGAVKFKEITLSEDLTARILAIDANGNLVDRPPVSTGMSTSLADGRVWIGNSGGVATAVDTAAVGDIDADSVAGLTIKSGTIIDADINSSAAIAYSKLALVGSVVNADISSSAAIAYSKLSLTGAIVNADINASAAITRTKLAAGTAYRLLANNASGVISENAAITANRAVISDANGQLTHSGVTAAQIGYSSNLTGDIQAQLDDEIATKTVKAVVKSPTASEHGYAITWDNSAGQWDLTDPVIQGIPLGGTTRQVLAKIDGTDWNAGWTDLVLDDITDVSALVADLNLLAGADAAGLTPTHLSYLIGTTSSIQTQLGNKLGNSLAQNAIFVGNSSNQPAALAAGSDGQVLTVVSGVPQWQTLSTSGSPGGSTTQIQYNNSGAFAGDASFVWDATNDALSIGNMRLFVKTTHGIFIGNSAGNFSISGGFNIGIGSSALASLTSGISNTVVGMSAGLSLTTGNYNVAFGVEAVSANSVAHYNVGVGTQALKAATAEGNTALGYRAGYAVSTGTNNVLLGYQAGDNLTTGAKNVIIGSDIDAPGATFSGQLSIQNIIFGSSNIGTGTTPSTGRIAIGQFPNAGAKFQIFVDESASIKSPLYYQTKVTGESVPAGVTIYQNILTTTDATPTTINSVAASNDGIYYVEYTIIARQRGGTGGTVGDGAAYQKQEVFRYIGGTLTQIGTTTTWFEKENNSAWSVGSSISGGSSIDIQVTGAADSEIVWSLVELKVSQVV